MNVASITSRTVKTYTVAVEGGEIRPKPYSRQGTEYRVTRVEVVKRDGNVDLVTLSGPTLKKDGSDSMNSASERIYRHKDWPNWLTSIIGGLA
jgi:hypothetical protein